MRNSVFLRVSKAALVTAGVLLAPSMIGAQHEQASGAGSVTSTIEQPTVLGACSPPQVQAGASFRLAPFNVGGTVRKTGEWQPNAPWSTSGSDFTWELHFDQPVPADWLALTIADVNGEVSYSPVIQVTVTGSATPSSFSKTGGELHYDPSTGALIYAGGPAHQDIHLTGNSQDLVSSLQVSGTGIERKDYIAFTLFSRSPCLTVSKVSENGTGSFRFDMSNVVEANASPVPSTTLATSEAGASVTSPPYLAGDTRTDLVLSAVVPDGWSPASAVCTDRNANATGNPSVIGIFSSPRIAIPAANVRPSADIECLFRSVAAMPGLTVENTGRLDDLDGDGLLDPDETISYAFLVTNRGDVTLTGVTVDDPLLADAGLGLDQGPQTLAPGGSFTFTATYTASEAELDAGWVENTATAVVSPPSGPIDRSQPDTAVVPPDAVMTPPSLALQQTGRFSDVDGNSYASPGDALTYNFTVTNTGGQTVRDVWPVDAGPTFNGQRATGTLSRFQPEPVVLAPGQSQEFAAVYTLTERDIENAAGWPDAVAITAAARGRSASGDVNSDVSTSVITIPAPEPGEITVTKVAGLRFIRRGEQAPFTIRVANSSGGRAVGIAVVDTIPPGFRYVEGSATVDGAGVTPEIMGRRVRIPDVTVDGNGSVEIRLRLLALGTAGPGQHVNHAHAEDPAGNRISNEASARVEIVADPIFDCSDIVGRVFDDVNRNGYQDEGELGLAGVRVATVKGRLITTDRHGRFHVACADLPDARIGTNFIMKLDERTLPAGYRLTSENPRVVRLTAGKMTELNFGASTGRDVSVPNKDWFNVGLADLTIGKRTGDARIEDVRPGEYDEVYSRGRLAFYLKGKIKGEYLLTAAADTGEDELDKLFRNLDGRDPRQMLRRLNPDAYYPVYGDDATFVEEAPTRGKFYVRLERSDSHMMWGNYKTRITGTEFLPADRALYGASGAYRSKETTSFGERRTEVTAYAAQPDTLPQREEFLGTGGSAYFLKRQDIVHGSETVRVETRDPVSDRVIERRVLAYGQDYTFDYMQGVIILRCPLSSMTGVSGPVRDGTFGGGRHYLTVQYEYEPLAGDMDGYVYGGRAQHWLNDKLRVGVTGMDDSTDLADQRAYGADVTIRHTDNTYLSAEVAHSKGRGFDLARSSDGGLTWGNKTPTDHGDSSDDEGLAWRVEGQVDLDEVGAGLKGRIGGYYEEKEAGFSTLFDDVRVDRRIWGAHATVALNKKTDLALTYDDFTDGRGQIRRDGSGSVSRQFDRHWKVSFGVTYTELMSPLAIRAGKRGYHGSRLDAGIRVDYRIDDARLVYAFGQGTLERSGDIDRNDRAGIGAKVRLTDKIGLEGEVSYGTHGVGGLAGLTYDPNADSHYYLGYKLDPDRSFDLHNTRDLFGSDKGTVVAGLRRKMGDLLSAYSESNYDLFGERRSLTQGYGVVYKPDALWTVDAGLEVGRVRDDTINRATNLQYEDFDRYAPSLAVGYKDEEKGITARARGEVRIERSDTKSRNQDTYLFTGGVAWKTSRNWRLLTHIDAVLSDSRGSEIHFADTD